jgi:F0F1-type ATP synthase assembly protein I
MLDRLSERRELNNGFGNALAKAFELAVTPAIFGYLGWLLDGWLGTRPLFLIALFMFTAIYTSWRMFSAYSARMQVEEDRMLGPRREVSS